MDDPQQVFRPTPKPIQDVNNRQYELWARQNHGQVVVGQGQDGVAAQFATQSGIHGQRLDQRDPSNPEGNMGAQAGMFASTHHMHSAMQGNIHPQDAPHQDPIPLPQMGSANVDIAEIVGHMEFERLAREIFLGRKIGEDGDRQKLVLDHEQRVMEEIRRSREDMHARQMNAPNPELDRLLRASVGLIKAFNQDLIVTASEADHACTMFEQQIQAILKSARDMDGPVGLTSTDDQNLRKTLKRKYGPQIQQLREEFRHKKKKGKLPNEATEKLRQWWNKHLSWPYPSEDEKRTLARETTLNATQINNWFINQRKRHWHKYFKDGCLPQSPEEAGAILRKQGVIH